jgi:hypothetical protein
VTNLTAAAALLPLATDGPPFRPSPNGLLSTVTVRDDPGLRWATGASFRSNTGIGTGGTIVTDGCAAFPTKSATIGESWLLATTIVLYGWWECAPVGYTPAEAQTRAHEVFLAAESRGVEEKLWPWLKRDGCTAATSMHYALAAAEQAIGALYGGEGLIHMSRAGASAVSLYLQRSGASLRTIASNTPVVVGDGYDLPANLTPPLAVPTSAEVVASGPMIVVRGPLTDLTPDAGSAVFRGANDLTAVVERAYQVYVDAPQGACYSSSIVTP